MQKRLIICIETDEFVRNDMEARSSSIFQSSSLPDY